MALYTEKSFNDISSDWEAMRRRELERQQQEMASRGADLSSTLGDMASKKQDTNFFGNLISGIGEKIADTGKGITDMFGSGAASIADILTGNSATGKNLKDWKEWTKKELYGNENMSDKEMYAKKGGTALNAASTVADFIPGVGAVGKTAINVGQGVIEGIGDAAKYADGGNIDLGDATSRALAGGAGAFVGDKVGGKLVGKFGNTITGGALRGGLSGAASGATSGAIMGVQNGDVLGGAIEGAKGGALGGATIGGGTAAIQSGINRLAGNNMNKQAYIAPEQSDGSTTATGWGEKDMTDSVKKRNKLQKAGDTLKEVGQNTKDSTVTSKLKGNLAEKVAEDNSIQRLRDIGFNPSDYEQAGNLSEVVNKYHSDATKASTVKLDMPDTYDTSASAYYARLSPEAAQEFKNDIRKRLDAVRIVDGNSGLATFDAKGLEKVAKGLGQDAEKMTTTNMGGRKKWNNNLSHEAEAYAKALTDFKQFLRGKVDDMTDYDGAELTQRLKDAGATQKQIDYITKDAKGIADIKSRTSLLEDARNMNRQIKSSPLKRGANADNSTSITTQAANKSGLGGLLDIGLSPIASIVGGTEKLAGKGIGIVGDLVAGKADGVNNLAGRAINGLSNLNQVGSSSNLTKTLGNIASRAGNREVNSAVANTMANQVNNAIIDEQMNQATSDFVNENGANALAYVNAPQQGTNQELASLLTNAQSGTYSDPTTTQMQTATVSEPMGSNGLVDQLSTIGNAMQLALNAGDLTSYSKLADLYEQAYGIYATQLKASSAGTTAETKLSDTQKKALTAQGQLQTLAGMNPDAGTFLSGTPLGGLVGMFGGNEYANQAQSLALTLGYLQSGANVSQSEAEKIGRSYIPTATDSDAVKQQKLARAQQLIDSYLAGTKYSTM